MQLFLLFYFSWSVDGNWIAAVNYHYIKNHKVYHVKLIDMKGGNSEILIGHEAPVLVAVI